MNIELCPSPRRTDLRRNLDMRKSSTISPLKQSSVQNNIIIIASIHEKRNV
jgi:hypothetical protein